ncbi:MAG: N(4)-(beta-N-acetylglucosaminyl)-L-asparaginase [Gemmatimonadetes bacterium]|nr:N(4)-(beta-N-acetylglucosaminyl)-L-asparaginase [Gemmatimonadota bacterium]
MSSSSPPPVPLTRRRFLRTGVAASVAAGLGPVLGSRALGAPAGLRGSTGGPLVVASGNGLEAVGRAFELLERGSDPLDAAIAGVNLVEEDPADYTVGYGGIPNADGAIQLDACCMHGPTHRAGAVAALEGVRTPSRVAHAVLEHTDHVLLVGAGALAFARLQGFAEEDLHTPFTRELYRYWKGAVSARDDYLPPPLEGLRPDVQDFIRRYGEEFFHAEASTPEVGRNRIGANVYGTINCNALDARGNVGGVTTTSGLFFKIPGRVGDSPIAGAGLYVDNDVGAAGSTGRGEANLLNLSSHLVVERMRGGAHPRDACLEACRRIVENNVELRLQRDDGRPNFGVNFYALDRTGRFGAASIWSGATFAVADRAGARKEEAAALFEKPAEG